MPLGGDTVVMPRGGANLLMPLGGNRLRKGTRVLEGKRIIFALRGVVLLATLALLFTGLPRPLLAQGAAAAPQPATLVPDTLIGRANAGTVGVISGGVDGTYIRIAADLAAVLDDGDRLRVLALIGKGSVKNLSDIMMLRGIDIGIVQSDVLAFAKRDRTLPAVALVVQYIAKLYDEEVHVLARRDITRLEDLAGKPVNIDVRGSGTAMTASLMFDYLRIATTATYDDQGTALEKLKTGQIAAMVYVAGKPARLFSTLDAASGLHFLPVPMTPALLDTYLPSSLGHDVYPGLVAPGGDVYTIAVGAVMAVYGWPANTDRYKRVARFVNDFFDKFEAFQRPPRHPKWKEVNIAAQVPGWTRFAAAQDWLNRQPGGAGQPTLRTEFDAFTARTAPGRAAMTEAERDALFQQFMDWQKTRRPAP